MPKKPKHLSVILPHRLKNPNNNNNNNSSSSSSNWNDISSSDDKQQSLININHYDVSYLEEIAMLVEEIVAWTLLAKIPCLSIYRQDDVLRHGIENILCHLDESPIIQQAFDDSLSADSINDAEGSDKSGDDGNRNGLNNNNNNNKTKRNRAVGNKILIKVVYDSGKKIKYIGNYPATEVKNIESLFDIQVNLLSRSDGRKKLVDLTKDLCSQVASNKINSKEIDISTINRYAKSTKSFPDPELVLVYSEEFVLYNYPPWHLKNSELHHIPSVKRPTMDSFYEALYVYASTEQRYGK
ncbi:hypothetical protein H4219_005677 [Mycoemilia scoparia]|uniref:ditrans,polycis-polyprenyl diphosphate synthase [(2E,6E)-farnesyldiphosphate specific] n=1 Tax=Mycoemilia scoparia TaxID=417184 RepID=A0A9W7ZV57_9FUNG|nr:hypothetical protein H4219_005677 [Mycoemilia scoparia]